MGIKDQFQDKANEMKDKARKPQQGAKDEATRRAEQLKGKKAQGQQESADTARDTFDESWDE